MEVTAAPQGTTLTEYTSEPIPPNPEFDQVRHDRFAADDRRREARRPRRAQALRRRGLARGHLRRARPDRQVDRQGHDRQRHRARRQGRDPRRDPRRVDLQRLRRALRRCGRGADLPDQLARGVRVRAQSLRGQAAGARGRRASSRRSPRSATTSTTSRRSSSSTPTPATSARRSRSRSSRRRARPSDDADLRGSGWHRSSPATSARSSTPPARPARRRAA